MKTIRFNIVIFLLGLACPALAHSGDGLRGKYEKEKKISKTYLVNPNCALNVKNMYGSVYVTTWDEDKTAIEVVIKVSSNKEELAEKRINSIDVDINATRSLVRAVTRIGNFSGRNTTMEINYTIKIPKKGSIDLDNQYGRTSVGKIYGRADIHCQYGDLAISELNNEINSINVQYSGMSQAAYIKNAEVYAQYSSFSVAKGGSFKIDSQYTDVKLQDVQDVTSKGEYGELIIGEAGRVTTSGDYSNLRIDELTGQLNVTCNYGDIRVKDVARSVKNIVVIGAYTNTTLGLQEEYAFDFEFSLNYGTLGGAQGLRFQEKVEKDSKASYKGYYKSPGNARIYVKAEYGNINLKRS